MNRPQRPLAILLAAALAAVLVACGQGTAPPNSVTKVTVAPASLQLSVGETGTLTATVTTNGTADLGVTWSSADTSVASVNGAGVVTGVAAGSTTITATSKHDASKKGSAQVTVTEGSTVEVPLLWHVEFPSAANDWAEGIAIDSAGNVIVAGATFGDFADDNAGAVDAIVAKYSTDGAEVWARQFGTPQDDYLTGVAVDSDDNIYVVGYTRGSIDGPNAGNTDVVIRKYSPAGAVIWTDQFGTSLFENAYAVAVDGDGNVIVAGRGIGTTAGFVRKYEPSGDGTSASDAWTTNLDSIIRGLAVDGDNNVFAVGDVFTAERGYEAYAAKLDPDGDVLWDVEFGTGTSHPDPFGPRDDVPSTRFPTALWDGLEGYDEAAYGVTIDAAGAAYVTGYAGGFDGGTGHRGSRTYVLKLDPDGLEEWALLFQDQYGTSGRALTFDADANLVVIGNTTSILDGRTPPGTEMFTRTLAPDGSLLVWEDIFGTSGWDIHSAVAADADGNVYTTGYEIGEGGAGANPDGRDVFLRKYGP